MTLSSTITKVAALALDDASSYNEKRTGAKMIARLVEAEPAMYAGLSGADILDFIAGMLEGRDYLVDASIALSSLIHARIAGLVSAETIDDACGAHYLAPEGDIAIERAGAVIFLATLVV